MSGYDYMLTTTYISITKQIAELWENYDKDGDMDKVIEEFKYFYGNHENSLMYYDFDISTRVETLLAQRFIIQKVEDMGFDMDMSALKRMTTANGLEAMLLYWIMEDFDFESILNEKIKCDFCDKILRRKNMILHTRSKHSPQKPPTEH
jgi:hypothetical protein